MSAQVSISAKVPEELSQQVDRLAAATRRNRSWVVEEALRSYLARELQFLDSIELGIEDYKAGRVIEHDEILARFARRRELEQE